MTKNNECDEVSMTLAETIYAHSLQLPEEAGREVLDFIDFLVQRYHVNPTIEQSKMRVAGSAKGKLTIVNDDSLHLNDFREYIS
jgi:hypothetical protein